MKTRKIRLVIKMKFKNDVLSRMIRLAIKTEFEDNVLSRSPKNAISPFFLYWLARTKRNVLPRKSISVEGAASPRLACVTLGSQRLKSVTETIWPCIIKKRREYYTPEDKLKKLILILSRPSNFLSWTVLMMQICSVLSIYF